MEVSARNYGTWKLLTAFVRLYAGYKMESKELYVLAMWSYAISAVHCAVEWLVFRMRVPVSKRHLFVSLGTLLWMMAQSRFAAKAEEIQL